MKAWSAFWADRPEPPKEWTSGGPADRPTRIVLALGGHLMRQTPPGARMHAGQKTPHNVTNLQSITGGFLGAFLTQVLMGFAVGVKGEA